MGSIAVLPGPLVAFAWSIGVAGVEVKLGRVGGAHAPTSRALMNADNRSRFELLSVFSSFVPEDAVALLEREVPTESGCGCPTCRLGGTYVDRVADADSHAVFAWRSLQRELSALTVPERLERLEGRLGEADRLLRSNPGHPRKGARLKTPPNHAEGNARTTYRAPDPGRVRCPPALNPALDQTADVVRQRRRLDGGAKLALARYVQLYAAQFKDRRQSLRGVSRRDASAYERLREARLHARVHLRLASSAASCAVVRSGQRQAARRQGPPEAPRQGPAIQPRA